MVLVVRFFFRGLVTDMGRYPKDTLDFAVVFLGGDAPIVVVLVAATTAAAVAVGIVEDGESTNNEGVGEEDDEDEEELETWVEDQAEDCALNSSMVRCKT